MYSSSSIRIYLTLLSLCLLMVTPLDSLQATDLQQPVRFAIISDRTGGHEVGIYGQIIDEIARLRPDFVMTVGDLIEGYVDDSLRIASEWDEYDSLVAGVPMPIYFVPGNHDIWSDMSAEWFRRRAAKPYYSFERQGLHMIVLENGRWSASEQLPQEQIDWLRQDLMQSHDAAYTLVFIHKPFWYESTFQGQPDILHDLFVEHGVDAVFTGHYHEYFSAELDGIRYTCVGSSGGGLHPAACGLDYHYAWVTVDSEGVHTVPIKMGSVLPWEQATAGDKLAYDKLKHLGLSALEPVQVKVGTPLPSTEMVLLVDNTHAVSPLSDSIRWEVPEHWQVLPDVLAIDLPAGGSETFSFWVTHDGQPFPRPVASVNFAFNEGISAPASAALEICRETKSVLATTAPTVDGDLSEACWREPAGALLQGEGSESASEAVEFFFSYDADNLYLAARCRESMTDSLIANATEHDGSVWGDDCIGYFLAPAGRMGPAYQIYFNPQGIAFDQKLVLGDDGWMDYDRAWNGEYEVITKVNGDNWTCEVRIPLSQLETEATSGDEWRVNFRRKQPRVGNSDWQTPIDYNPQTYGMLIFE